MNFVNTEKEKSAEPATLQDFLSRGYTEIARRGNTAYLYLPTTAGCYLVVISLPRVLY